MLEMEWLYVRPNVWKYETGKLTFYKKIIAGRELYEIWVNGTLKYNKLTYWEFLDRARWNMKEE
jgi:hypothetical protein